MDSTKAIAIYGAIVATFVFLWDVFKWFVARRASISVSVSSGMQIISELGVSDDKTYLFVNATNTGDRLETISHVVGRHYRTPLHKYFRMRPLKEFVSVTPVGTQRIPYELKVGTRWAGGVEQTNEIVEWAKGYLYVGVQIASEKQPLLERVVISDEK